MPKTVLCAETNCEKRWSFVLKPTVQKAHCVETYCVEHPFVLKCFMQKVLCAENLSWQRKFYAKGPLCWKPIMKKKVLYAETYCAKGTLCWNPLCWTSFCTETYYAKGPWCWNLSWQRKPFVQCTENRKSSWLTQMKTYCAKETSLCWNLLRQKCFALKHIVPNLICCPETYLAKVILCAETYSGYCAKEGPLC